ncbi:MAG: DNA-directed RNA polymerase subunit omega [Candidatus Poribacteria bacterium]|nr:DNA-directed RNA polymerase subunit omega [Candidatus Poribacteria bacterium]
MPIYLEDVLDQCGNKYLAVNIAAERACQINEQGLPMLMDSARKPVSIALDELVEDKIGYKELDESTEPQDDFPFSAIDDEKDPVEPPEALQPPGERVDNKDGPTEPDEREEGL